MRPASPSTPTYSPGSAAPASGVYLVRHYQHRLPHEVTVLQGDLLPRCNKCGQQVVFELLREAVRLADDVDLREPEAAGRGRSAG
jgi:hypothetical protein